MLKPSVAEDAAPFYPVSTPLGSPAVPLPAILLKTRNSTWFIVPMILVAQFVPLPMSAVRAVALV